MRAKGDDRKLLLILGCVAVVLCLVAVGWHLAAGRGDDKPNPIRPKDFPEILVAPEGAGLLDHSTPWNRRSAPHTYGFSFVVEDAYPSEETRRFIKEHLSSSGWRRLNYQLQSPTCPAPEPLTVPEYLDPEMVDMLSPQERQNRNPPVTYIREGWVSRNNQYISVMLYYLADLATKEVHRDKAYVNLTLFERESWVRPYILKYRELHPEEFRDGNDL